MNEMPKLEGSEKQIAWAEKIRTQRIQDLNDRFNELTGKFKGSVPPEASKLMADTEEYLIRQTSAAWWIDNRFTDLRDFTKAVYSQSK